MNVCLVFSYCCLKFIFPFSSLESPDTHLPLKVRTVYLYFERTAYFRRYAVCSNHFTLNPIQPAVETKDSDGKKAVRVKDALPPQPGTCHNTDSSVMKYSPLNCLICLQSSPFCLQMLARLCHKYCRCNYWCAYLQIRC